MKRILSLVLTVVMLFSAMPCSVLAEEITEDILNSSIVNEDDIANYESNYGIASTYGNEVVLNDFVYYIEDSNLLCSQNSERPRIIDDNVVWIIKSDDVVYYAKNEKNNTHIIELNSNLEIAKLFCPIDAFDVEKDYIYYSYNNELFKLDIQTNEEEVLFVDNDLKYFYVENGSIYPFTVDNLNHEFTDDEIFLSEVEYDTYKKSVDKINNSNPKLQGQIHSCNPGAESGLCNVSAMTMLLNRKAKHIGATSVTFDVYDVFNGNGVKNVKLVGKTKNGYDDYTYSGGTGSWASKKYTDKSGVVTCQSKRYNSMSQSKLVSLLNSHPEGVAIRIFYYDSKGKKQGHCITITDYEKKSDGSIQFYAVDPVDYALYGDGREKIENTWMYKKQKNILSNINFIAVIEEYTYKPLCSNCALAPSKSFKYKGDGVCTTCGTIPYNYKSNETAQGVDVGVWKRNSKTTYGKLYLRKTPYTNEAYAPTIKAFSSIVVHSETTNADGGRWYYVTADGKDGYIVAYKVDADYKYYPDEPLPSSFALVADSKGELLFPKKNINKGSSASLRGMITSTNPISYIKAAIYDSNGKEYQPIEKWPGTTTYNIKGPVNNNLKFGKLPEGTYYVAYTVKDSAGGSKTFYSYDYDNGYGYKGYFMVGKVGTPPTVTVNDITGGKEIIISCSDSNAQLYYSLNGGKTVSIASGNSIKLKKSGDYSLKTWSVSGSTKSTEITRSVNIPKAPKPSIWEILKNLVLLADVDIDVNYGNNCAYVTISGEGNVYYTTDGSEPTENSNRYTEPFPITESKTVRAVSIQAGYAPSDVETKEVIIKEPEPPTISLYNTKEKIAQGKTATVTWEKVKYATSYTASLYLDGECIDTYTTEGNTASFILSKKSDTENYEYTIKVVAENFVGPSKDSNAVMVTAMHPVTVTFVDRITRTGDLTESKLEEVKEKINLHEKNDRGYKLEGQTISIQKVDYDSLPSKPAVPSKKGFDFAGWSAELFEPALADKTVYADYEIKYYTVAFYDIDDNFDREAQPLSDEKYMYTDAAIPPANNKNEVGYALAGWTVDVANSNGTDYNYVDGDMIVDAVYKWANMDLPAVLEITSIVRDDKSYRVNIRLKNNNELTTQARVVVGLYTSEGKNVYSQISEQDLDLGNFSSWGTIDEITLIYSGKISYAKAFLVAVENDRTGGALSEAAYYDEITYDTNSNYYKNNGYWGPWSAWSDTQATASEFVQVESKPQYRYRDKQTTTTNNSKTLSGWNYSYTDSSTGSWIYNGTNWVGTEDSEWRKREVSTNWVAPTYKTQYHYFTWYKGSSAPWTHYSSSHPNLAEIWIDYELPFYKYSGGINQYGGSGYNFGYSFNRWLIADGTTYGLPSSSTPYFTRSVQTGGGYTEYSYRDTYYTHHFWKWGGWSSWSDYYPSTSSNREIGSKTQWRYREWIFNYDSSNEPEESSNIYPTIEGVLNSGETEYITEEEYNSGNYSVISGPYYKNDDGEYVDIENRDAAEYRYGRYTNGTYVMPCKELAEELYGGEWQLEYTDWSETQAETTNESVYSCDNIEHTHADATQKDGMNYWNEYVIDGKSYCFVESRDLTKEITYTDTNKYYLVNKDLEGKVATVLVYKKTNTDPTQGQLEYADQITVGSGNTYAVTINTKELCEYGKTDDFIVSIALEGCKKLLTVGVIEAEAPKYEVCFTVNGEEYVPDCNKNVESTFTDDEGNIKYIDEDGNIRSINAVLVSEGESIDVNAIGIPEVEGYRFVKWDKSLVNITGRVDVKAVLEKEEYAVVFVDHANETVELQELYYGDPISAPEVMPVDGKIFKGWDNQSYRYVTEENSNNEHYTIVDGPYYKTTDDVYVPVEEYSDENIVDGTKYYRVLTDEVPVVTGNLVITAVWETIKYNVKFCSSDGTVVDEQEVEHGESATPPACVVIDGVTCPWNTNGQTWWNVTEDMIIYPYEYIANGVVSPISDTAPGSYDSWQVINLETQENTPVYYTLDMEITNEDAQMFVNELENVEVSLLSVDADDADDEIASTESDYIMEYSEPIVLTNSSYIYAFTVKDGEISPISVYYYEISEPDFEEDDEIDTTVPQITMPNFTAKPGDVVTIPVSIKNNPGVSNLSLVFAYDAENLTLVKAENGDVFKNSEYSSDIRDDGSCKFTWLSSTENTTDGTLVSLQFKVGDTGGNYSIDMSIEEAETSEEEMPFVTQDSNIENIGSEAYMGDANGDGEVTFADAIVLIRYDIGFATLDDYQLSISDVNGDGDVDFADAIKILRFDAGFISSLK